MPSVVAASVESKPMPDALRLPAPYPSFKSESNRLCAWEGGDNGVSGGKGFVNH